MCKVFKGHFKFLFSFCQINQQFLVVFVFVTAADHSLTSVITVLVVCAAITGIFIVFVCVMIIVWCLKRRQRRGIRSWKIRLEDLKNRPEDDVYGPEIDEDERKYLNELVSRFQTVKISLHHHGIRTFE